VGDVDLEVFEAGRGPDVLVLHGEGGLLRAQGFLEALAEGAHVVAPSHPGFGRSTLPEWLDGVDDAAYVYLDLLDERALDGVVVVGCSLGGWIAAEMAVRRSPRIRGLVLVDAVGIRVSEDRQVRDVADVWALHPEEVLRLGYHDPQLGRVEYTALSDEDAEITARNQQAAVLYGWKPFLNDPKLRRRLGRVDVPALVVWGESDGITPPEYGRAYAAAIPGARFETVSEAGHYPDVEQPDRLSALVRRFAEEVGR
jgi:pimeloyl-ACP methyl ester carboxylesterase